MQKVKTVLMRFYLFIYLVIWVFLFIVYSFIHMCIHCLGHLAHKVLEGNKDSIGIGLQVNFVTFWQRTCLHFVHALRWYKAKFKGDVAYLMEEISRKNSMQGGHGYCWLF
jgi:hypothetical protein